MPSSSPSWAQNLTVAYAYDINSHGFSAFAKPNGTSLEVSVTQSNASGNGWNAGTFYGMSADGSKPPYTDRRDFYPNGAGQGGILASQLMLVFRKVGTNETATFPFTPANTPYAVPRQVSAGTTNLPTWAQSFDSAYTYDTSSKNFTAFANSSVANLKVAISQDGAFGDGWQSGEFYTLPQQSGSGYTHRRDFNRSSASQPGVSSAPVVMAFRSTDAGTTIDDVQTAAFTPVQTTSALRPGPVVPLPTLPTVPNITLPTATVGQAYTYTLPALTDLFNRPLTYAVTGLPPNLAFNSATRTISGTPTSAGDYNIQIRVTNQLGRQTTVTVVLTVTLQSANRPPVAPSVGTQLLTVNVAYIFVVDAFNDPDQDPLTYSASGLPAWLSFNSSTRTLSGTPTATGTNAATITANDGRGGITSLVIQFVVSQPGTTPGNTLAPSITGYRVLHTQNPEVFAPVVTWQGGRAYISNLVTLIAPNGQNVYYWLNGLFLGSTLPNVGYPPGTTLTYYVLVSTDPKLLLLPPDVRPEGQTVSKKASCSILIGNTP